MDEAKLVLIQIAIMFIFILIGYILRSTKLISDEGSKTLGNILVYAVVPSVILNAFMIKKTNESTNALFWAFLLALISLAIAVVVSLLVFKKKPNENFCSAFSNAAFIGIPLISGVLGSQYVIYVTGIVVFVNILQFTYGQFILSPNTNKISFKKILLNPLMISTLIGLLIYFIQIPIPSFVKSGVKGITALNSPLAMFILGVYLKGISLKDLFTKAKAYVVSLFRLIIIPLLTFAALYFIPCPNDVKLAILICSAAPVGSNIVVFSIKNNLDTKDGVVEVLLSTLLCIITIPLFILLVTTLFNL